MNTPLKGPEETPVMLVVENNRIDLFGKYKVVPLLIVKQKLNPNNRRRENNEKSTRYELTVSICVNVNKIVWKYDKDGRKITMTFSNDDREE